MWEVGRLKDSGVARKIERKFLEKGISGRMVFHEDTREYVAVVDNEEHIQAGHDIYRVHLGLKKPIEIPEEWEAMRAIPLRPISLSLIVLSVSVYLIKKFVGDESISWLFVSEQHEVLFKEVMSGEIWRLWSPMFLHFNFFHILFNSMWIKDLGKIQETQMGGKAFILFVLVVGLLSNLTQYFLTGPGFGGLSGLVYGLLGYLWMYRHFHPDKESFALPKHDVYMMIGWFVLCMTGMLGPIANGAHGLGLTSGMLWGIFSPAGRKATGGDVFKYSALAILFSLLAVGIDFIKMKGLVYLLVYKHL